MSESELDVAIVGAGLAGLACAARLRRRGLGRFAVIEQGEAVGAFWRGNYDRIRLHSPFHDLPDDGRLRRRFGMFLARDELLAYLEAYAQHHRLASHLRFGHELTRLRRKDEGWEFETSRGVLRARYAVVATAYNRIPTRPVFAGEADFRGRVLHSREYRNPAPFVGKRVLVVGSGNSSAEIALDLVEGGAAEVSLWVRAPRHVIALRRLARLARIARLLRLELTPTHIARSHQYTRTHPEWSAQLAKKDAFFARLAIDLSRQGIRRPETGAGTQMYEQGRIAWYDQGTAAAIGAGRIRVIDGEREPIERLTPSGVGLGGGRELECDALVLGTGFEPGLEAFVEDRAGLLGAHPSNGRPNWPLTDGRSRSSVEPSLFFAGFDLSVNGGLSLGLWGAEIADAIASELGADQSPA